MSKPKKKRSKAYRPKAVERPQNLMVRLLPELSDADRTKIDLASLLPLDAIRRGEGTKENVEYVLASLLVGWILGAAFEEETRWPAKAQMMVGYGGMLVAEECIKAGTPEKVQQWMVEPAQHALELLGDLERTLTRAELHKAYDVAAKDQRKLCCMDSVAVIRPDDPSSWKRAYDFQGVTYLHGSATCGILDELDGALFWWDPDDDVRIRITGPTIMIISLPFAPEKRKLLEERKQNGHAFT